MVTNPNWRAGLTAFTWGVVILAGMVLFFWTALATEVPWMERMGEHGTGTLIATAWLTGAALLALVAVLLLYFRGTRPAAVLGWAASLPLFVALYALGYSTSYCSIPGC